MEVINIALKAISRGIRTGLCLLIILLGKLENGVKLCYCFSGGIMLSVVFSDLLPEALEMVELFRI